MTNIVRGSGYHFFKAPVWNEEQQTIVVEAVPSSIRNELWAFTPNLELIEKFSVADLAPVTRAWMKKQPMPEHKYAWIVEKLWYPPKVAPPEFALKGHTIERKRIDPQDAVTIW